MTCASCVARVEQALGNVPGVAQANVNLASRRARVALADPVDPQALVAAIADVSYDAALLAPERDAYAESARDARAERTKRDAILALTLSVPFTVGIVGDFLGRHWMLSPIVQLAKFRLRSLSTALAAADLGVAMGGGTDVALETAGVALMRPDLRLVPAVIDLSQRAVRAIRRGLFWAFAYNVLGIPLAAFGFLRPVVAGAAMALSSVSVVLNALTLTRWRPRFT